MNIDSIKTYPSGSATKLKRKNTNVLEFRDKSAEMCDKKNVNRGYYGGSFTGINMNRAAAEVFSAGSKTGASIKDGWFEKILGLCDNHTVIAQNLVALVLAVGLRPLAIMSLPGKKDKEDKIYASGHSIASGLIGFGFSSIVMYPLGKAASKAKQKIQDAAAAITLSKNQAEFSKDDIKQLKLAQKRYKVGNFEQLKDAIKTKYGISELKDIENLKIFQKLKETYQVSDLSNLEHSKIFKNVSKFLEMAPDVFLFGIAKGMLTIALIPPILKYGFGVEKKKKVQPEQQVQYTQSTTPIMEKPEMNKFAGGVK